MISVTSVSAKTIVPPPTLRRYSRFSSRMSSMHHLLLRLPKSQTPEYLTIFSHLTRSLSIASSSPFDTQFNAQSTRNLGPQDYTQDLAKIIPPQLSNCSSLLELNQIYAHILRTQLLESFPATFHWNNIIRSYTRLDAPGKALCVYVAMSRAGVLADSYTLPIVLKAVCQCFAIEIGRQLHSLALRLGLDSNEFCESGFINLYSKAGEFKNAREVFAQNLDRKLGSWNALIGGLSQGGRAREAIGMFMELRKCGFLPDDVTMVSVTSACGSLGDLDLALQLHKCAFQAKPIEKPDILMMNSLIDMYGKCGRMDLADKVFSRMDVRNVSSWTSMIFGYAMHGHVQEALEYFGRMREAGERPNHVTFVAILTACVHGGKVQEGKYYFHMMKNSYGIAPQLQHYGCMVDLLGRAGLFDEARETIEGMPMKANSIVWGCLMGACEKYGNVRTGEWVAKHLQELEPWNDGAYVVLSNIYASRGLWKEVETVREVMKQSRLAKVPGYSLGSPSSN